MAKMRLLSTGICIASLWLSTQSGHANEQTWTTVDTGMQLGVFATAKKSHIGSSKITILRIDPQHWEMQFAGLSKSDQRKGMTAKMWSQQHKFTAVINAGMFATDYSTHIGYLRENEHVNNRRVSRYQSIAAFGPHKEQLPRFRIFDLDADGVSLQNIIADYRLVVQNLRLIKRPGINRWSPQSKQWSEAALGEDANGHILFIFTRSPYTMHDLNNELLAMDINLVAAQHLEGGPEAQIYLKTATHELEMFGSYESSFNENNANLLGWPIPNVLGIRKR